MRANDFNLLEERPLVPVDSNLGYFALTVKLNNVDL